MQHVHHEVAPQIQVKLSGVIAALSYALDITEGQPKGHAARACMLGMRIARELRLDTDASTALFYALLMKDLGCSSNSAKMCYLFGADDRQTKAAVKTVDWTNTAKSLGYIAKSVAPDASILGRAKQFAKVVAAGQTGAKELIALRCERGATISRKLDFPEPTGQAILSLDEHWDGGGHPLGQQGEEIPLLARVLGISQTVEVFIREKGFDAAMEMVADRSGTWFDPTLAEICLSLRGDTVFWQHFNSDNAAEATAMFEPPEQVIVADDARLDQIAEGFSQVIDAKSSWTFKHSAGVARIAAGIATTLGYDPDDVRYIRRAGLVHDIGKLGISNLILDKPGKLTDEEFGEMRRHPHYTLQILSRVDGFKDLADLAASHHERLDGKGYHRGRTGDQLDQPARLLVLADMYEALTADRPYRKNLTSDEVTEILRKGVGTATCPLAFEALQTWRQQDEANSLAIESAGKIEPGVASPAPARVAA